MIPGNDDAIRSCTLICGVLPTASRGASQSVEVADEAAARARPAAEASEAAPAEGAAPRPRAAAAGRGGRRRSATAEPPRSRSRPPWRRAGDDQTT